MKSLSALVVLYVCLYICKYVGAYFTVICTYVGYMYILIFPVEGGIIIRLHHYKAWCCGYLLYL